jgi:hypothetical protein
MRLEEGERLPSHVHIGLPAHEIEKAGDDRLLFDERRKRHGHEAKHQHGQQHEEQFRTVGGNQAVPAILRPHRIEHVDKPPHEIEEPGFEHRDQAAKRRHGAKRTFCLARVEPGKAPQRPRRLKAFPRREGVDPVLEDGDDGTQHCSDNRWRGTDGNRFPRPGDYKCVSFCSAPTAPHVFFLESAPIQEDMR